jgi:hypothetical protein
MRGNYDRELLLALRYLHIELINDISAPQLKVMYDFMYVIRFPYAMLYTVVSLAPSLRWSYNGLTTLACFNNVLMIDELTTFCAIEFSHERLL